MKIGLVLERFDPARGGLEHWTWQFARALETRGHEVHVIAFDFHPASTDDGIVAHRLDMPRSRLDRAEAVAAALPELDLDIVHDMGIGWNADIIHPHSGSTTALWEHNLMRIPKWRRIRFWREKRYRELAELERRQLTNPRPTIIAVSRMVAGHFGTYHQLPGHRIRIIYNGVDVEKFAPRHREKYREAKRRELGLGDEVLFLMLAHNLLLKNADTTIRAAAKLIQTGAPLRLVVAGGKRPDRFVRLAHQFGIARAVTFLGLVDPIPYYAAADVFVHPTWYDPCSLVTLEASACGLPVVTTRLNGASELMTHGKEGFVLSDPADVSALASSMGRLMDPSLREVMGKSGREFSIQHTFEQQTTEFLELYCEIVSRKGRAAS